MKKLKKKDQKSNSTATIHDTKWHNEETKKPVLMTKRVEKKEKKRKKKLPFVVKNTNQND